MASVVIICDAKPFTGNLTTASRMRQIFVSFGLTCDIVDILSPPISLTANCVLLVAIHARKGGAVAISLLDNIKACRMMPPALAILLSGTDVNEQSCDLSTLQACSRAQLVLAVSPDLSRRYNDLCTLSSGVPRSVYIPQAACTSAEVAAARARADGTELRMACGLPAGAPVALLVAGIRAVKAPGFLLPIFAAQTPSVGDCGTGSVHLAVVGPVLDVSLFATLIWGAHTTYLPPVPRSELLAWMAQAAAVVNCSEAEGQPCALLEAMAVGCAAVVARRIPGNEAIVEHGITGLLFDTPAQALDCCRHAAGLPSTVAALQGGGYPITPAAAALRAAATAFVEREHSPEVEAAAWRRELLRVLPAGCIASS